MITGIVVALPEELSSLTSQKIAKGNWFFISDAIVLVNSGAGADNARKASEALIAQGATRLISWGCAAALSNALNPGNLVLADTLIDAEMNQIGISPDWHSHTQNLLSSHLKVYTGSLAESHSIVATGMDKQQLHRQTGAIAVDMESIAIAKVAAQHQLPFLAIRTIADPVNMDLPEAIQHSLNRDGDMVMAKLLGFIALHPAELPGLIKLGLHFNAAKKTLKLVAQQLAHLTATACQNP